MDRSTIRDSVMNSPEGVRLSMNHRPGKVFQGPAKNSSQETFQKGEREISQNRNFDGHKGIIIRMGAKEGHLSP